LKDINLNLKVGLFVERVILNYVYQFYLRVNYMQESTIWTSIERNDRKLDSLFDSLENAYSFKRVILLNEEEEYQYAIHEFRNNPFKNIRYVSGQIVKFKREREVDSFNIDNDSITQEQTNNPPIIGYSNFVVFNKNIWIEQKGRILGQRQVLNAILKFCEEKIKIEKLDIDFVTDSKAMDQFIETQEKIILIRFSNIILNPDNPDRNIQRFEEIIKDSNSKNTEFSNSSGEGINKESSIVKGGLKLAEMQKLNVKIEGEIGGEKQEFNSSKGRNKQKEKVKYEKGKRDESVMSKLIQKIKELI
jgi:hypothetical protein